MVTYTDLNYTKFPPLLGIPLTLDSSVLLFRSYDINYPILSDRPAYFSTYSNGFDVAIQQQPKYLYACVIIKRS